MSGNYVLALPGAYSDPSLLKQQCKGQLTPPGYTFVPINFDNRGLDDWRIEQGTEMLDQALTDFNGSNILIVSASMGARCVNLWHYHYGVNTPYDPANLNFINIADSTHRYGGIYTTPLTAPPVNTPYKMEILTRQYDGYADGVHDLTNKDATLNQWYGAQYIHPDYFDIDTNPSAVGNSKFVEGNITYVWSRTDILPCVQTESMVYRLFGIAGTPNYSDAAKAEDNMRRPGIESAYNRPVSIGLPSWAA